MTVKPIEIAPGIKGGDQQPLFLIAGPCVIESEELILDTAAEIKSICASLNLPFLFKSSFDKANRSSINSFRGPGIEMGLKILDKVKYKLDIPLVTDIHTPRQAEIAAEFVDVLQIPAFLCRQTDLLIAAAATGKTINVKKGQFLSPWDTGNIVTKIKESGNQKVCLTERGSSFGYRHLVVDMKGIPVMRENGVPVIFDATHSVQLPGGLGDASGGMREYVPTLSLAAAAAGIDGLFLEVHPDPDKGKSDGPNMWPLSQLKDLLKKVMAISVIART